MHDCVATLEEVRASGKTRFIGVSAVLPHIATFVDWGAFDAFQIVYSALEPEHEETITAAAAAGAGAVVRGGSAKGAPLREQGRGGEFPTVRRRWVESGLADVLEGMDLVSTMFRYSLAHPAAHTFINGTKDLDHLKANIAAAEAGPWTPPPRADPRTGHGRRRQRRLVPPSTPASLVPSFLHSPVIPAPHPSFQRRLESRACAWRGGYEVPASAGTTEAGARQAHAPGEMGHG